MTRVASLATLKTELKERFLRLIDESDEQGLARLQMFVHRAEGGVDDGEIRDEDLDTLQGYTREENVKFLEDCEQTYQDMLSGKEPSYSLQEFKDYLAGRLQID